MARILVVEDNGDIAQLIILLLAHEGHEVRVATNGEDALTRVESDAPEVAVLDIALPGIDGIELARRIRASRGRSVRIIALTGYIESILPRRQLLESGFDEVLRKPVDFPALRAAVTIPNPADPA
jgi:CheY-like chemotaxis protein